jgi:Acetyltransferases, including N-acetylases of ribosomal proteins
MSIIRKHDYVLKKDNIRLRPMTDDDLDLLMMLNSDLEVLYWSDEDATTAYTMDRVIGIYGSVSQNAWCFIIEYNGIEIGECWLQKMNMQYILEEFPREIIYRIDISIGIKTYWNQGIGHRVIKLLTEFGFVRQNADKIFYLVEEKNKRSVRAAEKAGYVVHAIYDHDSEYYDVNMIMTRTEYFDLYD